MEFYCLVVSVSGGEASPNHVLNLVIVLEDSFDDVESVVGTVARLSETVRISGHILSYSTPVSS